MQGRPGQEGEPGDSYRGRRPASLNGTGKHRPLPQRPTGILRVDTPPQIPRVARPQRQHPRRMSRGLFILGGVFLACAFFACVFGYIGFNYFNGLGASSGAATTANDFLQSLTNHDYEGAYKDLGGTVTMQLTLEQFKQQAQRDDTCYGVVKNYAEVNGSATMQGNSQSYGYTITRDKLPKPYQLHLTLQQDSEASNVWKVTSYGDDLGPAPPTCK